MSGTPARKAIIVGAGTLALSADDRGWVADSLAALGPAGYLPEPLDRSTLAASFLLLATEDIGIAFFLPQGGALFAERIIRALANRLGPVIRCGRIMAVRAAAAMAALPSWAAGRSPFPERLAA